MNFLNSQLIIYKYSIYIMIFVQMRWSFADLKGFLLTAYLQCYATAGQVYRIYSHVNTFAC